ncbi:phenylalanine--tRNA ligase subunit alpha [Alloprevotella rava]|uniref:Phenylalanine--tRNA ligase alpha subunit n=1 Tax=Alloprevotella rava TaxID=671218 RepID=A0A7W5UWU9_9BACT|nr:phenylalanine--tRNA ligase subunit alpha [Alloprevotella rava]MBB3702994.1 phenylalanyl-tRNA synthetase alpha chain [Alloprevotella rava]
MLAEKIQELLAHVEDLKAKNAEQLELLRIKYLSKKGVINDLITEFRNVPNEQKRELGMRINEVKTAFQDKINSLRQSLAIQEDDHNDLDLTRTPYPIEIGTRHPISLVRDRLIDIFNRMGFTMAEGPEVEDDWHVFSSMNFAADHPARDMQDTFVVEQHPDIVLRSHTSSVQARVMEKTQPPIRVICPGRVYRNEAISSRAHCFFHQLEGLYIDEKVSFADLMQVMLTFSRELFGPETKIRMRPSYFPFTEPSAEMDISCHICGGTGRHGDHDCVLCKGTGWVEILGCGMVDPNVLELNGIDSKKYTGYAFGLGLERIANLLYRVRDLRLFSENDKRFLEEFMAAH